jgi:hypothetical protein
MSVGDLATLPALAREPAYASGRGRGPIFGVDTPTPVSSPVSMER